MNRKRDSASSSSSSSNLRAKRRGPIQEEAAIDKAAAASQTVVVMGLGSECSVLDLKSRFEIYGPISRTRLDPNGLAYVTFRSLDAAHSAFTAAKDPSFQLTLQSRPLQVMWATDPVPQWREAVSRKHVSSRLVRPQLPLSRSGRPNNLLSANHTPSSNTHRPSTLDATFKARQIVGYHDIL